MPKHICPICRKSFDDCCDEQLQHIIELEKDWNLFYDDDRQIILNFIRKEGVYRY